MTSPSNTSLLGPGKSADNLSLNVDRDRTSIESTGLGGSGSIRGYYSSLDGRRRNHTWNLRSSGITQYLGRLRKFPQMDFEFALWTMFYLCVNPRLVYRSVYYQKQTKNQWARDDPAFVVLLTCMILIVAVAYGLAYTSGFLAKIRLILWMAGVDFLGIGLCVAAATWFISNKYLLSHASYSSTEQKVEFAYAWDVHCNSFFPLFLITYVLQFLFIPIIDRDAWLSLFLANTMYLIAITAYIWITYLGFSAQPFLRHTHVFLYPLIPLYFTYFISLFTFNVSRVVLKGYFGL